MRSPAVVVVAAGLAAVQILPTINEFAPIGLLSGIKTGFALSKRIGAEGVAMFEPVHGSAPDIAGRGIANPLGAIWSASLMLDHLGEPAAARRLMDAIEAVCRDGVLTRDLGGTASTAEVGDAVAGRL